MQDYSRRIEGVENMEFTGRLSESIVLEACKRVENNQPKVVRIDNANHDEVHYVGNIIISGKTEKNSFEIIKKADGSLFVLGLFRGYCYKNGTVAVIG